MMYSLYAHDKPTKAYHIHATERVYKCKNVGLSYK